VIKKGFYETQGVDVMKPLEELESCRVRLVPKQQAKSLMMGDKSLAGVCNQAAFDVFGS
jgi:hypothetical protein